jgi:type IV secretory pathway protease TraF
VDFDKSSVTTASLPNVRGSEGIFSLLQVLREELHFKNRKHPERVVLKADSSSVIVCLAKECRITEEDPLLILDATASSQVSEKLFGPLRQTQISIHQQAFVTQVYDRTGHNTGWNQKIDDRESYADVASLINALKGWVAHGSRPLVVSHKMLADHLREKLADDSGVAVAHFQALRGSNEYEDCDVVFITGRHSPPADAIDRQGRALFWDDEEPLQHDDVTERLPSSLVGFWMNEGENHNQMGVYVEDFSDPRLSAVYEQTRQAEVAQAIARLRLVWSRSTKRVFLLGNLPVEVPVDCVVEFNNLFPDRLERELIEKGDMPLTAKGMFKMRPDLFENANAASKALSRSILSNPKKLLRVLPEQLRATLTEVTFRAEGARLLQKHLFLPRIDSSERSVLVWKGLEIDEITAHLEQGWGEGNVRDIELRFVHEGQPEEAN